jgi:hypothetical protein
MPTSLVLNGQVLDWNFKKYDNPTQKHISNFYTGDILQGQIHNLGRQGFSAISFSTDIPEERRMCVNGFKTRYAAAKYLLELHYHSPKQLEQNRQMEKAANHAVKAILGTKD